MPARPALTTRRALAVLATVPLGLALLPVLPAASAAPGDVRIEVLSGRGDVVSGGDALLRIVLPAGSTADGLRVDDDGRDVTGAFAVRPGAVDGLVTGLSDGRNVVTAVLPDGRGARITLTNGPLGGPVFSGPQIEPWTCVGEVDDEQCNREPTVRFLYKSTRGGTLRAYDAQNPPATSP
jgi:hypothetical protein